jgi:hypothetical protein
MMFFPPYLPGMIKPVDTLCGIFYQDNFLTTGFMSVTVWILYGQAVFFYFRLFPTGARQMVNSPSPSTPGSSSHDGWCLF